MFTSPSSVQVKCKRCGKPTPSNEFTLDPVYRMMVCKKCVAERHLKENPIKPGNPLQARPQTAVGVRPLSAPPATRPQPGLPVAKPKVSSAVSSDKIKQRCKKCSFSFLYDAAKGYPLNCPNCGHPTQGGKYEFF